jgi:hypothetical protein
LLTEQISPEAKKKDAFKGCEGKRQALLTLVLMAVTQATALNTFGALVQTTC